jgi:hypothetical protein
MGAEEGILYAECNLELGILAKLRHDFAGHYNRPDIFQLHVNRTAPHLYAVHGREGADHLPAARPALAEPGPGGLLTSPESASPNAAQAPTNGHGRDEPS